jgi:protein ImuB
MTIPQELYACLYIREFPAQAMLRLRPELRYLPCAIMAGEPPLQQVCSLNSKARNLGIAHGMTRVELDTFPSISVLPRSRAEEATAKLAMLECAGSFSPRVEDLSGEDDFICVIDISGTEKLHGPAQKMGKDLIEHARTLGVVASVAVSSNFYTAIFISRGRPSRYLSNVIPHGEEKTALRSLPLTVLDLPEKLVETFFTWGIYTLGMLAALPERELIARLGQEGKRLRLLARGEHTHLFQPVAPVFSLEEKMELEMPVELLDSLLFVIRLMLEQLILRATARILALASVTVTLSLEGGLNHTRTVSPALPTNDMQIWIKLIHLDLETHPPQAAILSLVLSAEPGATSKVQLGLFSPQLPESTRLDVTLARIRAIVGEDNVGSAVLKDTHRTDGFRLEPFVIPTGTSTDAVFDRSRAALRKLRPAESTTVMVRGKQPEAFLFRDKRYVVEHAYGPWLASSDWWTSLQWNVEQWDLVAHSQDGTTLCCCLVRDPLANDWHMVAFYD